MKNETISQTIHAAHDSAAFTVAQSYLANLEKDTANTLGTLAGLIEAFRIEVCGNVRARAAVLGASRCKVRLELVELLAKNYVRTALRANPELAAKLLAIRAAQDAKARAEAIAEQATWAPLPLAAN